jgi:hypothetical protein
MTLPLYQSFSLWHFLFFILSSCGNVPFLTPAHCGRFLLHLPVHCPFATPAPCVTSSFFLVLLPVPLSFSHTSLLQRGTSPFSLLLPSKLSPLHSCSLWHFPFSYIFLVEVSLFSLPSHDALLLLLLVKRPFSHTFSSRHRPFKRRRRQV